MYFRIDDRLHSHVKAMKAGVEAMGLWALAGSWSASQLTDGWVPEYAALRIAGNAEELASSLVRAGLWHRENRDGEAGWAFHEWDAWQHTREYVEERQRRARERMRAVRTNIASSAPNPKPNPKPKKTPAADAAEPDQFAEFWNLYPRKVGKDQARRAYAKALKSTTPELIGQGLAKATEEWAAARTEARFIPHAATWLNGGRWADEHTTPHLPGTESAANVYDLPPLPEPPDHIRAAGGAAWTQWAREERARQRADLVTA